MLTGTVCMPVACASLSSSCLGCLSPAGHTLAARTAVQTHAHCTSSCHCPLTHMSSQSQALMASTLRHHSISAHLLLPECFLDPTPLPRLARSVQQPTPPRVACGAVLCEGPVCIAINDKPPRGVAQGAGGAGLRLRLGCPGHSAQPSGLACQALLPW